MKQFCQVVDINTLVSDMKILCTVDQDVFHCQIFLTRDTDWVAQKSDDLPLILSLC